MQHARAAQLIGQANALQVEPKVAVAVGAAAGRANAANAQAAAAAAQAQAAAVNATSAALDRISQRNYTANLLVKLGYDSPTARRVAAQALDPRFA